MSKRVMIVEDEDLIAKSISFALRREGFETEIARDGEGALDAFRARPADVLILDIVLAGGLTGFDVCRIVRTETIAPIIMLSARGAETDKVLGLERGADDYVTKPFSMHELIARVQAHLRRVDFDHTGAADTVRSVGDITIDRVTREVTVAGEPVHLTVSEFALLGLLSERRGEVVPRAELLARLWSPDFDGATRTCDAHIRRLRTKIEHDPRRPRADPHGQRRRLPARAVARRSAPGEARPCSSARRGGESGAGMEPVVGRRGEPDRLAAGGGAALAVVRKRQPIVERGRAAQDLVRGALHPRRGVQDPRCSPRADPATAAAS